MSGPISGIHRCRKKMEDVREVDAHPLDLIPIDNLEKRRTCLSSLAR
jgi:hypothetical protein